MHAPTRSRSSTLNYRANATSEQRAQLIEDLTSLASDKEAARRIRPAISALTPLLTAIHDDVVVDHAQRIVDVAEQLVWGEQRSMDKLHGYEGINPLLGYRDDSWDAELNVSLSGLVDLISSDLETERSSTSHEDLQRHQQMIRDAFEWVRVSQLKRLYGDEAEKLLTTSRASPIALALGVLEDAFGALVGQVQVQFPEMPVPTWVWERA